MGYRELLQALEEEVARQVAERRAEASLEAQRVLDAARGELVTRRERVLAEERRALAEAAERALSAARLEQEHALLAEMRERITELRQAAEVRLAGLNHAALVARLVDELVPELDEGPLVFRVRPGHEADLEDHLRRNHPQLLPRATVEGSKDVPGGVEVLLGTRQRLDNTLRARLENAWRRLEPEIAALLLQHGDAPPPRPASRDEAALVASHAGANDGAL